jgi:excisionase family DNA binding protein
MSVPSTGLSDAERKEGARKGPLKGARGPPDPMIPLTVKECAAILKVNPKTLYQAVRQQQIPAIRVSKLLLIPRPAFEKLLRDGTTANEVA